MLKLDHLSDGIISLRKFQQKNAIYISYHPNAYMLVTSFLSKFQLIYISYIYLCAITGYIIGVAII